MPKGWPIAMAAGVARRFMHHDQEFGGVQRLPVQPDIFSHYLVRGLLKRSSVGAGQGTRFHQTSHFLAAAVTEIGKQLVQSYHLIPL